MAHDRSGPDIVMQTRYAGASEIRSVTDHEINRSPDGSSAIDPMRSHLNRILHGPSSQQEALDLMWQKGVRPPAAQSESPYVQTVLSASPAFFYTHDDVGNLALDQRKLDDWVRETMTWLKLEYGDDLAHASLHLDETTPHVHVLIIPTYTRKSRQPSRRAKSGETIEDFEVRLEAWKKSSDGVRTAGRSSSNYWSKMWCRRDARKSYHAAVAHLGLGYGRDFVEEGQPSPDNKLTGTWVREQAADFARYRATLSADMAAITAERAGLFEQRKVMDAELEVIAFKRAKLNSDRATFSSEREAFALKVEDLKKVHTEVMTSRRDLSKRHAEIDATERHFLEVAREIDEDRHSVKRAISSVMRVVRLMADTIGIKISGRFERDLRAISDELSAKNTIQNPSLDDGPGF